MSSVYHHDPRIARSASTFAQVSNYSSSLSTSGQTNGTVSVRSRADTAGQTHKVGQSLSKSLRIMLDNRRLHAEGHSRLYAAKRKVQELLERGVSHEKMLQAQQDCASLEADLEHNDAVLQQVCREIDSGSTGIENRLAELKLHVTALGTRCAALEESLRKTTDVFKIRRDSDMQKIIAENNALKTENSHLKTIAESIERRLDDYSQQCGDNHDEHKKLFQSMITRIAGLESAALERQTSDKQIQSELKALTASVAEQATLTKHLQSQLTSLTVNDNNHKEEVTEVKTVLFQHEQRLKQGDDKLQSSIEKLQKDTQASLASQLSRKDIAGYVTQNELQQALSDATARYHATVFGQNSPSEAGTNVVHELAKVNKIVSSLQQQQQDLATHLTAGEEEVEERLGILGRDIAKLGKQMQSASNLGILSSNLAAFWQTYPHFTPFTLLYSGLPPQQAFERLYVQDIKRISSELAVLSSYLSDLRFEVRSSNLAAINSANIIGERDHFSTTQESMQMARHGLPTTNAMPAVVHQAFGPHDNTWLNLPDPNASTQGGRILPSQEP